MSVRILSVVGARPQFVKLGPIAKAFRHNGDIEHVIVHTGQHYDPMLSEVFFSDLGIEAPANHLGAGSGTHGRQTGLMLERMDAVLEEHAPDWVLVYGDTNSTLAGALSAVKMHIPVAHLEAGLRSFNRRMPEEHNRVLTDHAADLLLAPTQVAMEHLRTEGLESRSVLVGDVMTDVCFETRDAVSAHPASLVSGMDPASPFVVATIHRADNTDDPRRLGEIVEALGSVEAQILLLAHPRLRAKAKDGGVSLDRPNIFTSEPLAYPQMVRTVQLAAGVVTDSGGLQKEAYLLQTPCTTLRTETEWVETLEDSWNILDPGLAHVATEAVRQKPVVPQGVPYGDGHSAERVAEVLVQRMVH